MVFISFLGFGARVLCYDALMDLGKINENVSYATSLFFLRSPTLTGTEKREV